jgi:hypothetical protein
MNATENLTFASAVPAELPKRRGRPISLDDPTWSVAHVAKFLACSEDHAARWLDRNKVPRHDIGVPRDEAAGDPRQFLRVAREDVMEAWNRCRVPADATAPGESGAAAAGAAPSRPMKYRGRYTDDVTPPARPGGSRPSSASASASASSSSSSSLRGRGRRQSASAG